jgi:hypothetical protein
MYKQLTESEYKELMMIHPVLHFMGGCQGDDKSHTIYLVKDEMHLVPADDAERIQYFDALQKLEAEEYMKAHHQQYYSEEIK